MALPTTNITTSMIKSELGATINNIGELCTYHTINIWSKRKPNRDTRISVPYNEVGMSDNCGLTLHHWSGDDTKITYYNRPGTWTDKTGQHTAPFRLGDFRGYEHNIKARPVTVGRQPDNLERRVQTISATVAPSNAPVVTLPDLPHDLRLGVIIYEKNDTAGSPTVFLGAASAEKQLDDFVVVDLSSVYGLYVDVKFALISGYHPWSDTMPTHAYELPRQYPGENPNWSNVRLVTPPEDVRTFQVLYNSSSNTIEYYIEAYETVTGRIKFKNSSGAVVMELTDIYLPANTLVNEKKQRVLPSEHLIAELYLGMSNTPVAIRPLMMYS